MGAMTAKLVEDIFLADDLEAVPAPVKSPRTPSTTPAGRSRSGSRRRWRPSASATSPPKTSSAYWTRWPLRAEATAPSSGVKSYLGQALAVAQSRRKVSWNVARVAEMPETTEPTERRSLTPDEARDVLSAAEGHRLETLFVTGMMLGLRPGELTGLRWDDVDLESGQR